MSVPSLARFKRCTSCQVLLPATTAFFTTHKLGKYGLVSVCRVCRRLKDRVPWERHRSNRKRIKEKECRACGVVKPRSEFYERKSGQKIGVLSYICKSCDYLKRKQAQERDPERTKILRKQSYARNRKAALERQKQYAEANREKVAAYQKQYREEHQEEKKAYSQEYWPQHYAANRKKYIEKSKKRNALRQGHQNRFLKADIEKKYEEQKGKCYWCGESLNGDYEIDHIIPLSKGGTDYPGNVCCACQFCNRSKSNKMPYEFSDRLF